MPKNCGIRKNYKFARSLSSDSVLLTSAEEGVDDRVNVKLEVAYINCNQYGKDLENTLKNLNASPMYNLSLSSKELFHSNFLAWLGSNEETKPFFVAVINNLAGIELDCYGEWVVARENKNFDLCIKKDNEYILVIENKVKSIPIKSQLDEYVGKIGNKNVTKFLLLTLVDEFPNKEYVDIDSKEEKKGCWKIKTYNNLAEIMDENKGLVKDSYLSSLLEDYIYFIKNLCELQKNMIENFETQPIFKDVEVFRKYRLHDLYIKLQCAKFLILLKKKLEDKGIAQVQIINRYAKIREEGKRGIYLNQNIFNSIGQIAAFIYREDGNDNNVYEIVIQGNQYRHGINSNRLADKSKGKIGSQNILWNNFKDMPFERDFLSMSKIDKIEGDSKPKIIRKNKKSDVQKEAPFCGYDYEYIYRYKEIYQKNVDKKNVDDLLNIMADDICRIFKR